MGLGHSQIWGGQKKRHPVELEGNWIHTYVTYSFSRWTISRAWSWRASVRDTASSPRPGPGTSRSRCVHNWTLILSFFLIRVFCPTLEALIIEPEPWAINRKTKNLSRFSNNCAGQFKSQYTMAKLLAVPAFLSLPCATVDWLYYEPDHGNWLDLV